MNRRGFQAALVILGLLTVSSVSAQTSCSSTPHPTLPECPRVLLTTTYVAPTGPVVQVPAGGNFQAALNAATPGTTLVLAAGATYTGNFTLPTNAGPGWIYIISSALSSLPEGTRVTPAQASLMPKLVSPNNNPVLSTGGGAQFYRLAGIELTTNGGFGTDNNQNTLVELTAGHDITFDRCYIHGGPTQYVRQGIQLNNQRTAIIDSYLAEFHVGNADSQGIVGWFGAGPFKIVNNRIEGAAENILFGGADPSEANLVPSDIEIRGNHLIKPLSWYPGDPSYTGIHWTVKNLFELKNAQRVLVDGNILENCWVDHQAAFGQQGATGFVLTTRNQGGGCPWCVVQDVTITNNIARNLGQASVFGGGEGAGARRVLARNNLLSVNAQLWGPGGFNGGANGRLFHLGSISAVTIDHNTGFQDGAILWDDGSVDNPSVAYTNNLSPIGGAAGTGSGFQGGGVPNTTAKNVFVGGNAGSFPSGNFFPAAVADVGFINYAGGDYHLAASSPFKNAGTDGKDIGADIDALAVATACAISGACAATGPPSVAPIGFHDEANLSVISGWACDPDNFTLPISIYVYRDGPVGGAGVFVAGPITANQPREAGVSTQCGGNANHGFRLDTPASLKDGQAHAIYVYAINIDAGGGIAPPYPLLVNSPLTIVPPPVPIPGTLQAASYSSVTPSTVALYDVSPGVQALNNITTGAVIRFLVQATAGTYAVKLLVSNNNSTPPPAFHLDVDGVAGASISVPSTGSWSTYQWVTVPAPITLTAGSHTLSVTSDQQYFNLQAIQADLIPGTTPPAPPTNLGLH